MDSRQLANPVDVRLLDKPPVRTDDEPDAAPDLVLRPVKPHDRSLPRPELLERLVLRDDLLCQGCGLRPVDGVLPPVKFTRLMEIDHNHPRSAGGSNHVDNRVLLCGDCNRTKSDTMTLKGLRRYNKREALMGRPKKKGRGRKPQWELPQIDATPEQLARAILTQSPPPPPPPPPASQTNGRTCRKRPTARPECTGRRGVTDGTDRIPTLGYPLISWVNCKVRSTSLQPIQAMPRRGCGECGRRSALRGLGFPSILVRNTKRLCVS